MIALEQFGADSAPTVIFAHGFGQTRGAWRSTALKLAENGWRSLTYDARGHGDSTWLENGEYAVDQLVTDAAMVCTQSADPPVWVGASMGGLVGMSTAAGAQAHCRALVLVDITPRWESAGVARILHFMRAHPGGFASLGEAADAIAAYLPHRGQRKSPDRLRELLIESAGGRLRWHWDPRMLAPIAEDATRHQVELFAAARRITVPTLLISGAESDVVSESTIDEFLELVPHATHVKVPGATHMVAGDENNEFMLRVQAFLSTLTPI